MDPRIKVIYIRQLKAHRYGGRGLIFSRSKEWREHTMYTSEEILRNLRMGCWVI
jgi:hypothetical protein